MLRPRRSVMISTFTRVAFVTAARSLPEVQSTRATRSLWINVATTLLSLIAAMRLNKVVATFIHKDLVARVDCTSGNDLAAVTNATRVNVEIMTERLGRSIH